MQKNVTVLDSEGKAIGATYPKRAMGLVKKGRARYADGDDSVIILVRPPCINTSWEDDINMSNNFNFNEFIAKAEAGIKSTADTAAEAIDRAMENMREAIHNFENQAEEIDVKDAEYEQNASEAENAEETVDENGDSIEEIEEIIESGADSGLIEEELRAKIRAQVEHEKARREREAQKAAAREEAVRRAKEAMKSAAHAMASATATARDSINSAVVRIKAEYAQRAAEQKAAADSTTTTTTTTTNGGGNTIKSVTVTATPALSTEYILSQIEAVNANTAYISETISGIKDIVIDGPGDIGSQGKANALAQVIKCREETNRQLLGMYAKMLESTMTDNTPNRNERTINRILDMLSDNSDMLNLLETLSENTYTESELGILNNSIMRKNEQKIQILTQLLNTLK